MTAAPPPEPPPPPRSRTTPVRAASPARLIVLAAVGVAAWLLLREGEAPPPPPPDDAAVETLVAEIRAEGRPALAAAVDETRAELVAGRKRRLGIDDPLVADLVYASGSGVDWRPLVDMVERIRRDAGGPGDPAWLRKALVSAVELERVLGLRALPHLPPGEARGELLAAAVPSLDHESILVREEAAGALAEHEAEVHEALLEALGGATPRLRAGAAFALLRAGAAVPEETAAALLEDDSRAVRIHGAALLSRDGLRPETALPVLGGGIRQNDPFLLRLSLVSLAGYGEAAAGEVDRLRTLLEYSDADVRHRAAVALSAVGDAATRVLVAATEDPDPRVRLWAAFALGRAGTGTPEAVAALERLLADPDESVREAASGGTIDEQVAQITGGDPAGREEANGVRGSAAFALARIGPPAAPAIPGLIRLLGSGTDLEKILASQALARIGRRTEEVEAALEHAREHGDVAVRRAAEDALERLPRD